MSQMPNSALVNTVRNIAREWREWLLNPTFQSANASAMAKVYATNTSGQSIPNNAFATITNFTEVFDVTNGFTPTTGIFIAQQAGYYQIHFSIIFGSSIALGDIIAVQILANGVSIAQMNQPSEAVASANGIDCTGFCFLQAGQTISFQAFQNSGTAQSLSSQASINFINIQQVV